MFKFEFELRFLFDDFTVETNKIKLSFQSAPPQVIGLSVAMEGVGWGVTKTVGI